MTIKVLLRLAIFAVGLFPLSSCGDKPTEIVKNDTMRENPLMQGLSEVEQEEMRKIVASIPVPFAILNKVSGSGMPYRKDLLNPESNVTRYNTAEGQAVNIGVYGADMAYIIAFERLGESGPYLRCVRQLADAVVIPTVFNESKMKRYQISANNRDSMQTIMFSSYQEIDSTLQNSERFVLAALVVTSGWIESLYLTTQHLNQTPQSESTLLLYEMLNEQQQHTDDVISMLSMFPKDSLFIGLHDDIEDLKKMSSPAKEYTPEELEKVTNQIAAIRRKLVSME